MDNVISLSKFKDAKTKTNIQVQNIEQALALDFQAETFELLDTLKDRIFEKMPEYRFVIEDGIWDGEFEDSEPFTLRVRVKGTDIEGYGNTESGAWFRMMATLCDEGLI